MSTKKYTVHLVRGPVGVDVLEAAGVSVRREIEGRLEWMGGSEWYRRVGKGVRVTDQAGREVALVSYNGRLWTPDGKTPLPVGGAQ